MRDLTIPSAKSLIKCLANLPETERVECEKRIANLQQQGKFEVEKAVLAFNVNKESLQRIVPVRIEDVFTKNYPTLATLGKYRSLEYVVLFIASQIVDLCDFLNVGKNMNEKQIFTTAQILRQDFYYLNIADIKLFFTKCKRGQYGKIYDRIDGALIMEWMNSYLEERMAQAELDAMNSHKTYIKDDEQAGDVPQWFLDKFKNNHVQASKKVVFDGNDNAFVELLIEEYVGEFSGVEDRPSFDDFKALRIAKYSKVC